MASPPPDWGETVHIYRYTRTLARGIYMVAWFFPISFPAGIFICYGLEFRLVCLQRGRCSVHIATARAGTPRVKNRDLARPFPPAAPRINRYYFSRHVAAATCPGVYIT